MFDRELLRLRHGPFVLELAPAYGGTITRLAFEGQELMRPAGSEWRNPRASACFPLVPFSNRVRDAVFRFRGREQRLEPNFPPEPHAIHGHGWEGAWQPAEIGPGRASLTFTRDRPEELLRYRAHQRLALDDEGLSVELELVNIGDQPMPAGIGLHPYFPRTPETRIQAPAARVWLPDEANIPKERVPVEGGFDLRAPRRASELELDHCFEEFEGSARIEWPEHGLALAIEAEPVFGHVVVYVPRGREYLCIEPVSHVNDGFNRLEAGEADTGVRVLAPDEALGGRVRFRPEPLDDPQGERP